MAELSTNFLDKRSTVKLTPLWVVHNVAKIRIYDAIRFIHRDASAEKVNIYQEL